MKTEDLLRSWVQWGNDIITGNFPPFTKVKRQNLSTLDVWEGSTKILPLFITPYCKLWLVFGSYPVPFEYVQHAIHQTTEVALLHSCRQFILNLASINNKLARCERNCDQTWQLPLNKCVVSPWGGPFHQAPFISLQISEKFRPELFPAGEFPAIYSAQRSRIPPQGILSQGRPWQETKK